MSEAVQAAARDEARRRYLDTRRNVYTGAITPNAAHGFDAGWDAREAAYEEARQEDGAEALCPDCRVERADFEGPEQHLPECPNCGSGAIPVSAPPDEGTSERDVELDTITDDKQADLRRSARRLGTTPGEPKRVWLHPCPYCRDHHWRDYACSALREAAVAASPDEEQIAQTIQRALKDHLDPDEWALTSNRAKERYRRAACAVRALVSPSSDEGKPNHIQAPPNLGSCRISRRGDAVSDEPNPYTQDLAPICDGPTVGEMRQRRLAREGPLPEERTEATVLAPVSPSPDEKKREADANNAAAAFEASEGKYGSPLPEPLIPLRESLGNEAYYRREFEAEVERLREALSRLVDVTERTSQHILDRLIDRGLVDDSGWLASDREAALEGLADALSSGTKEKDE